jgi:GT2 family glycosyltransferase
MRARAGPCGRPDMRKDRISKKSRQPASRVTSGMSGPPDFPASILDEASKEFPYQVNSILIAASGAIFLTGWTDDRLSRLHQIRIAGHAWSKVINNQHIGRHRQSDVDSGVVASEQRLFGFWALTLHDRTLIDGNTCCVELVLANGAQNSSEVPIEFLAADDLRARFIKFWNNLSDADRLPPIELTYVEQALKRPISSVEPVMPKHNVEVITVSDDGGLFVNGWIDDTSDKLERLRVSGSDGQVTFEGPALARTCREDVQTAIAASRRHEFGFWGFAANNSIQRRGNTITVDLLMGSGASRRHEVSIRNVDQAELRNVVLTYLASAQHLGNPQLSAIATLENCIGAQIVDFNLKLSRKIVSQPYVEKFGYRAKTHKASIVVCLYGKPEFLFLQNSLFSNRPGIEDYEFIYVCNSPELAEPLLRDAHISSRMYDLSQTLIILPDNAGFGAANNAAVNFARTDRVLIVNPDVFPFDQDWAVKHTDVVEQLPREQTSLFGVPLYYDDGSLMHGGMYFEADCGVSTDQSKFTSMRSLRVEHYGKGAPPFTTKFTRSRPVPAVTGAFISLNRNWFEEIGGFSEEYVFGHYEDADLCLKSMGKGIAPWIHDVKLWHLEGKGSNRLPVHEGASIVNRWLFNKRWARALIPDMLGQSPKFSLLENETMGQRISLSPPTQPDANTGPGRDAAFLKTRKPRRRAGKEMTYEQGEPSSSGSREIEIVFSGK